MREVIFTADFATKKKGDEAAYDGQLAHYLVNVDKVAKYKIAEPVKEKPVKK